MARQDLIDKYQLTKPEDWDSFKEFLKELAAVQNETGVVALNTNANRNQTLEPYYRQMDMIISQKALTIFIMQAGKQSCRAGIR